MLVDPTDVRFRDLHKVTVSGETAICGYVNSKNRMGGYAGYTRFIASLTTTFAATDPQAGKYASDDELAAQGGFDSVWPLCEGKNPNAENAQNEATPTP